jgi:hypothetical protein
MVKFDHNECVILVEEESLEMEAVAASEAQLSTAE